MQQNPRPFLRSWDNAVTHRLLCSRLARSQRLTALQRVLCTVLTKRSESENSMQLSDRLWGRISVRAVLRVVRQDEGSRVSGVTRAVG